jgi:hypothetical protein
MTTPATPSPLAVEMKATLAKIEAAQKGFASKTELASLQEQYQKMQTQIDAVDVAMAAKHIAGSLGGPPLAEQLKNNDDVARLVRDKRGTCVITLDAKTAHQVLQRKTNLLESGQGFQTTGVLALDRTPGITAEARQQRHVDCEADAAGRD